MLENKLEFTECDNYVYVGKRGDKILYTIVHDGKYWICRDQDKMIVDHDQYRNDLFERLKL